jgi:hypothetical protein
MSRRHHILPETKKQASEEFKSAGPRLHYQAIPHPSGESADPADIFERRLWAERLKKRGTPE